MAVENPILSHFLGYVDDIIERSGEDRRSFARGMALAYYLISSSRPEGAPIMSVGSIKLASTYRNQPPNLRALGVACDGLSSQTDLNTAFSEALKGMPEATNSKWARFGGGLVTLGTIAAAEFGGTGVEGWFEPDQP